MTELLEILKSGKFQGVALLAAIAFSGLGRFLFANMESAATKLDIPWVLAATYWFMLASQATILSGLLILVLVLMRKDSKHG